MFGKKAARIKELEAQTARRNGLEQYLPLAADISRRLDAAASDTETFITANLEAVLHTAEEELRVRRFMEVFNKLPAQKRLEFLLRSPGVNGNAPLLQVALNEEIARIKAQSSFNSTLERSRREGRIDLNMIPVDAQVRFFLYTGADFKDSPKPSTVVKYHTADVKIDTCHEGSGVYSVINIYVEDQDTEFVHDFTTNRRYKMGMLIGEELDTTAHFGASLYFQDSDEIHAINAVQYFDDMNLKLGRIKVAKEEVFAK